MLILFTLSFFALGAIVGSFLNVVIYRHNTGLTLGGRSFCFSCTRVLAAIDLVPVLSFAVFGGKCRTCKSAISVQYPLVELVTGVLFAFTFFYLVGPVLSFAGFTEVLHASIVSLYYLAIFSLLVVIFVYDLKHTIIPNMFVYAFILLSLASVFVDMQTFSFSFNLWHLLAGPILFAPFAFLWAISKGMWMGFGDAKLAWGIGWFLGLASGALALLLSFWIGAVVGVSLLLISYLVKSGVGRTMKSEIPFAPFLIIGTVVSFFCADYIITFLFI